MRLGSPVLNLTCLPNVKRTIQTKPSQHGSNKCTPLAGRALMCLTQGAKIRGGRRRTAVAPDRLPPPSHLARPPALDTLALSSATTVRDRRRSPTRRVAHAGATQGSGLGVTAIAEAEPKPVHVCGRPATQSYSPPFRLRARDTIAPGDLCLA